MPAPERKMEASEVPMSRTKTLALVAASLAAVACPAAVADDPPPGTQRPFDRVRVRTEMLARMDAKIDADAAKAHLDARILLDETMPLPYLGVDADPGEGGMKITKVYPATGAEAAGLKEGDVILSVDGRPTPDAAALGLAIRAHDVGDTLTFRWRRGGTETEAKAVLGKRPEEDEDEEEQFAAALANGEASAPQPFRLTMETATPSETFPSRLEAILGGHGQPPGFVLTIGDGGRFLRQGNDDPTGIRFPMAWVRDFAARDVRAEVRFRLTGGRQDRAAGIVVRGENPWTYLVARANAVEGDLRIFRVVQGLRRTLPGARVKVAIDDGQWHVLRVVAQGATIEAQVDDGPRASSADTFVRGGRVGLWTKSDSVTDFDDFAAYPLPFTGRREGEK